MGTVDRQKVIEAAKHAALRSTVVTEVIEKNEDEGLSLSDRFAAMFAALLLCGGTYFVIWLMIAVKLGVAAGDVESAGWPWVLTWRLPLLATAITSLAAFLRPGWTYRYFGRITQAFGRLL